MTARKLVEIEFNARADNLRMIRSVVGDASREIGCPGKVCERLVLAVDEACANVIRHAYGHDETGRVVLRIRLEDDTLVFELEDFAAAVDGSKLKPRSLDVMRPGGLGLSLIDQIMDSWEFKRPARGEGNLLVMRKRLGAASEGGDRHKED